MAFSARHLLGIEQLSRPDIETILDLADKYVDFNRKSHKHSDALSGLTQVNMFFENSTRTQASFEIACNTPQCYLSAHTTSIDWFD